MVRIRNVGGGPVIVGERYLYPGESLLVADGPAVLLLAGRPGELAGEGGVTDAGVINHAPTGDKPLLSSEHLPTLPGDEEAFWDGEEPPRPDDGVVVGLPIAAKDNLRAIRGIGPRTAEALASLGVDSYVSLLGWDAAVLARALDGSSRAQVERWQAEARSLLTRLDG